MHIASQSFPKPFKNVHRCRQREIATLLVNGQQISKKTCRNSSLHKLKHSLTYTFVRYADSVCTLQVNPFLSLSKCSQCCQREIATLLVDGQQISKKTCRNSSLHKLKHSLTYNLPDTLTLYAHCKSILS